MKTRTVAGFVGLFTTFLLGPFAAADCWICDAETDCCVEAPKDTTGTDLCRHDQLHVGGSISCSDCWAGGGTSCEGTGESACDKELPTCEEHQSFLVVPHGQPIDLSLLTRPPVATPSGTAADQSGACSAV